MKKIAVYISIILLTAVSFLFSRDPNKDSPFPTCQDNYIALNTCMGFPVNCDAFVFIGGAIRPAYLLQQDFRRQSRPGFIIMGTVTGYSIFFITSPFHNSMGKTMESKFPSEKTKLGKEKALLYVSVYIGYVLINLILLLISLLLFEKIITVISGSWKNGKILFYAISLALLSNQVTQHFFWTVHVQIFNILAPLLCIFAGLSILKKKITTAGLFVLSTGAGSLLLIYGTFLLLLPTILFSFLYSAWKNNQLKTTRTLICVLIAPLLFFIPTFVWVMTLKLSGINYYSHEIAIDRQFIWVLDAMTQPWVSTLQLFYLRAFEYFKTFGSLIFPLGLLLTINLYNIYKRRVLPLKSAGSIEQPQKRLLLFILLSFFVFFWLLGDYADRLTTTLCPVLICIFAICLNQQKISLRLKSLLFFLIAAWHIYIIIFSVPHFSNDAFK